MSIDRAGIRTILTAIGNRLGRPTTLCVFGSAPAILLGQPVRMTQDIDVWGPGSDYLSDDLEKACSAAGVLYDPKGDLQADQIYLQIVRPGVVKLPAQFDTQVIERFGNLTIVAPSPAVIAAHKLVRCEPKDIDDIVWWMGQGNVDENDIVAAIGRLPKPLDRETARDNLVMVRLVAKGKR
jgi:hypothetical protein